MNYGIAGLLLIVFCLICAGCTQVHSPERAPMINETELEKATDIAARFMGDPAYPLNITSASSQGSLYLIEAGNRSFEVNVSSGEVVAAHFRGSSIENEIKLSHHYDKAIKGIRAFLENPTYDPVITSFTFKNNRYELTGINISFKVNASSGEVVSAFMSGPEAVGAIRNSSQYQSAMDAALNATQMPP